MKKSKPRGKGKALAGRIPFVLLLLLGGAFAVAPELAAQRTVHILQEPRHRTVYNDGDVRVIDVQINPGDTTLAHTHDSPIMYTFISQGSGSSGGRVSSNTQYRLEPFTHSVSNAGPNLFRIIAIAHFGEGEEGDALLTANRPEGLTGEPTLENPWFRSYRIELAPGQETAIHRHHHSVLVVQVSDGVTHVTREDGITAELTGEGDWTWRDPGSPYRIRNAGSTPLAVVVNEARRKQ
jgi:quercetin dioxygenase-like cupin family protein